MNAKDTEQRPLYSGVSLMSETWVFSEQSDTRLKGGAENYQFAIANGHLKREWLRRRIGKKGGFKKGLITIYAVNCINRKSGV